MKYHCQNFCMFHTSINLSISLQEGNVFADISYFTYPLAGRHSYLSDSLRAHPKPSTGRSITYISPGLPFYPKSPITYPTISQNSITCAPPLMTLHIPSYSAKSEHWMHSVSIAVFPAMRLCSFTCSCHDHSNKRWNIISRTQKLHDQGWRCLRTFLKICSHVGKS